MSDPVNMPSTLWSVILEARNRGSEAQDTIVKKYRSPVVAFIRAAGYSEADAEDITQETFLTLIQDDVLQKADRERGKFRSLLLAIVRHTMSARRWKEGSLKRGGDRRKISLNAGDSEEFSLEKVLASSPSDENFDSLWLQNLLTLAMNQLREKTSSSGPPYYEALTLYTNDGLTYAQIAEKLGKALSDVKNYIYQGRERLKRSLLQEIEIYSSSPEEYKSEVEYLMRFLK